MELEKEKSISNPKQVFQRYLFPIAIISSILISGSIGFTASQLGVNNSVGNQAEIKAMQNRVNEARNNSLKVIEAELPKIISDLENYNQDINLLVENVEWLNGNLAPIRNTLGKFNSAINVVKGVNTFVELPIVDNISTKLDFAQIQFNEIDSILFGLEKLTVIKHEMTDSHQKLDLLVEKYQKEKDIELLFQIEQELNSNLIYQIEDLRNSTREAHKAFELSSSVLITVDKTKSLFNSIQEMGNNTLNAIQFWKENEGSSTIGADINESLEKDIDASIEKLQKLPNELAKRSKSSITSINNVQKELQTIKIAQMISSE
ncbi:prefoldin subunit 5 [Bacillus mesophilus]|uniref:Uncharacterized protein n=1 Tax=Bacillus mesophilus TaxID=1808955 RepID=A0A6M0Q4H6_9BACI|nr:hypothetical protein [Bacillus mesophilus]MBM7660417.1 prefoldin subunit 5 [Bacillus mesophilus]NEY71124.1 hypothetical protein [Bacillus mesophilus]